MRTVYVRVASAALAICGALIAGSAPGMGASGPPDIRIKGQAMMLSPAMLGVGSVFMEIENAGNGADNLISAHANVPNTVVELHDVKRGKMVKVDGIRIPSRDTVKLQPGSLHIMVFKLPPHMKEGSGLTLTLQFEKSGEKEVPLTISAGGMSHGRHSGH